MRIFSVDFCRGRRGWVCRVWFHVATVNQFTDETHQGNGDSRWWLLAWWRAWRNAVRVHAKVAALPGERALLGWK